MDMKMTCEVEISFSDLCRQASEGGEEDTLLAELLPHCAGYTCRDEVWYWLMNSFARDEEQDDYLIGQVVEHVGWDKRLAEDATIQQLLSLVRERFDDRDLSAEELLEFQKNLGDFAEHAGVPMQDTSPAEKRQEVIDAFAKVYDQTFGIDTQHRRDVTGWGGINIPANVTVQAIACTDSDGLIGLNDELPYQFSEDMAHFAKLTKNSVLIMGRKTFESLGNEAGLPNRPNIVVSPSWCEHLKDREEGATLPVDLCSVTVVSSPQAALASALKRMSADVTTVSVIGGGRIYADMAPVVDKLYMTKVAPFEPESGISPDGDRHVKYWRAKPVAVCGREQWDNLSKIYFPDLAYKYSSELQTVNASFSEAQSVPLQKKGVELLSSGKAYWRNWPEQAQLQGGAHEQDIAEMMLFYSMYCIDYTNGGGS